MSSSSSSPRETIQISFGPSANAITAHLLNLQGLAATSSSDDNAYCDPNTTHYVQGGSHRGSGTLVPRVLMIDEATHQVPATSPGASSSVNNPAQTASDPSLSAFYTDSSCCWNGQIQVLGDHPDNASRNTAPFWKTASAMAYSPHSRYHRNTSSGDNDRSYRADPDNSRHVVWDDAEEEEEEEDHYERTERTRRQEQSERKWKTETAVVLGQELDRQVAGQLQQVKEERSTEESSTAHSSAAPTQDFHFNQLKVH